MENITDQLLKNSKASQLACIEIHNKPIFPFRYEVCTILNINSWELLLKAYILNYHKDVKVINQDGTTKPFDECLNFVHGQLAGDFSVSFHNIEKIYEYRCNAIHFYQEDIDVLLYSLLSKNVLLYHEFLLKYFDIDIANETNLILLPIGFKPLISPIDFLSNHSALQASSKAVQGFVASIVKSTECMTKNGIEDSIIYTFNMAVINENRIKNADIIAAVTKNESEAMVTVKNIVGPYVITDDDKESGVKKVKIEEENQFKTVYTETYQDVIKNAKKMFSDFKSGAKFNEIMRKLKGNPTYHKARYLDVQKQSGVAKNYFTSQIYGELGKHFAANTTEAITIIQE